MKNWIKNVLKGRLSRKEFLIGILLVCFLAALSTMIAFGLFYLFMDNIFLAFIVMVAFILDMTLLFYIKFSLFVRRLQDFNQDWKWALFYFVSPVNIILFVYLLFKKGDQLENIYGPNTSKNIKGILFNNA
jgi:uncharacterized membrane protein YhaH (DUF805 family)